MHKQLAAVGRSLAYAMYDVGISFPIIGEPDYPTLQEKNLVIEFWNALDRHLIHRDYVNPAIAITFAYLRWYRKGGHKFDEDHPSYMPYMPQPEWGVEYE
uniref:Uncharacterized protein n=1 Tax=viral metagenome TaxID=1070528 RepID=A0A6M3X6P7_9ZZZZ